MRYWLMKSEPEEFGIEHLQRAQRQTARWDGVRNFQVRNLLRDEMRRGDQAFFYHSSCAVPGIAGIMEIASSAYPDPTAFDPRSKYHDPASKPATPRWLAIDVHLLERFARVIALTELRADPALAELLILRRGNRLSITPVSAGHWRRILKLR